MVVRELITLFGFKTDKKSVETIDTQAKALFWKVRSMAAVAGAVAGWMMLKGIAEGVGKLGDEFSTLSERLGIATESLQEMLFAADRYSVSRQELTAGLKSLSVNAYEAATGGKEAAATFAKLGVRIRDTDGKLRPVQELFEDAADGLQRLDSDLERTALTQRVFGRAGGALVPMLKDGASGIKAMRQRAHEFGVIMSAELIQKSKAWDESTKDVGSALQGLRNIVADALLPHLERMNRMWTRMLVRNRLLIRQRLWKAIDKIGQVVEHVSEMFARAAQGVTEFISQLSPLQSNLVKVSAIALALSAALMLPGGSLIVLLALIGLVIDDFMVWSKGGRSVIGDLIGSMDDFKAAFPGVSEGLVKFWESLKWIGSSAVSLIQGITEIFGSLALFLVNVWSDPQVATKDFINSIKTLFSDFIKWLGNAIGVNIGKVFSDVLEVVTSNIDAALAAIRRVAAFGEKALNVFGLGVGETRGDGGATGTWGGAPSGALASGRAPANSSVAQSNKVDITVNVAGGGQNPEAIGRAVARPVEQVMETQLRNAMLDITNAAPGGEF